MLLWLMIRVELHLVNLIFAVHFKLTLTLNTKSAIHGQLLFTRHVWNPSH
jgi:hypothetical protein